MSDTQPEQKVCPMCSGQGKIIFNRSREGRTNTYETCPTCNGTGTAPVERGYEETPPTGMTTGKVAGDTEKDFGNPKGKMFDGRVWVNRRLKELSIATVREWLNPESNQAAVVGLWMEAANEINARHEADKQAAEKKAWAEGYHKGAELSQQAAVRAALEGLKLWQHTYYVTHTMGVEYTPYSIPAVPVEDIDATIAALDQPTGGEA